MSSSNEMPHDSPDVDPEDLQNELDDAIPAHCSDCGVQCELAKQLGALLVDKLKETADAEHIMDAPNQLYEYFAEERLSPEAVNNIKTAIFSEAAKKINKIDDKITSVRDEMKLFSSECNGVMRMRMELNGSLYKAAICTTASKYVADNAHIPAHVSILRQQP